MGDQIILPSKERIRGFHERSTALYEPLQGNRNVSRRYKRNPHDRDLSEYQVNEPAPTDAYFKNVLTHLLSLAAPKPDTLATLRRYVGQWARWLKCGLSTLNKFEHRVQTHLPGISSCWISGAEVFTLGYCQ